MNLLTSDNQLSKLSAIEQFLLNKEGLEEEGKKTRKEERGKSRCGRKYSRKTSGDEMLFEKPRKSQRYFWRIYSTRGEIFLESLKDPFGRCTRLLAEKGFKLKAAGWALTKCCNEGDDTEQQTLNRLSFTIL